MAFRGLSVLDPHMETDATPAPTSVARRWNPSRQDAEAPDSPWSLPMTVIWVVMPAERSREEHIAASCSRRSRGPVASTTAGGTYHPLPGPPTSPHPPFRLETIPLPARLATSYWPAA
jgi:hypothetical protein